MVNTEFLCFFAPFPLIAPPSGSSLQCSGAALAKVTSDFLLDTHISLQLLDDFSTFDGSWPHYHQILIVLAFCDSWCNFLALFYALFLSLHENIQALQGSTFSSPPILCKMRVSLFFFNYFLFFYFNWRLITILQWFLPYIDMNQPWVYMCSPSLRVIPVHQPWAPLSHASDKEFIFYFGILSLTSAQATALHPHMLTWPIGNLPAESAQLPQIYYVQTWSCHLSPCFSSYIFQFKGYYSYLDGQNYKLEIILESSLIPNAISSQQWNAISSAFWGFVHSLSCVWLFWPHELQHARLPCPLLSLEFAQTHVHWVDDVI